MCSYLIFNMLCNTCTHKSLTKRKMEYICNPPYFKALHYIQQCDNDSISIVFSFVCFLPSKYKEKSLFITFQCYTNTLYQWWDKVTWVYSTSIEIGNMSPGCCWCMYCMYHMLQGKKHGLKTKFSHSLVSLKFSSIDIVHFKSTLIKITAILYFHLWKGFCVLWSKSMQSRFLHQTLYINFT